MAYLTKDELNSAMRLYNIEAITEGDDTIAEAAIEAAIDEAGSALTQNDKKEYQDGRPHYDVAAIFTAEGSARHKLVLALVKDIAIYRLTPADNTGADYAAITDRYEKAIKYLEDLASGEKNSLTLPRVTAPAPDDKLPFAMGSRPKFNHE